ncbi:MAG: hypothetical protein ACO1SX_13275 [Actinomycetota bacterium]
MAYLVKLGEREAAASKSRKPAAGAQSWLAEVAEQRWVIGVLIAIVALSTGVITTYAFSNRSGVIAVDDPHSAQELADDGGGANAVSANGEVADDSASSAAGR